MIVKEFFAFLYNEFKQMVKNTKTLKVLWAKDQNRRLAEESMKMIITFQPICLTQCWIRPSDQKTFQKKRLFHGSVYAKCPE